MDDNGERSRTDRRAVRVKSQDGASYSVRVAGG